jgi:hypothetical protein
MDSDDPKPPVRYRAMPYDRQRVKDLLGAHITLDRVADVMGISLAVLNKHFAKEILEAGHRNANGHNPTQKDRLMVETMAAVGISNPDIAIAMRISPSVLKRHYAEELDTAAIKANLKVGANMLRAATGDTTKPATVTAGIWWSKNRMGWADKIEHDATIRRDPNELSDAELELIARRGRLGPPDEAPGSE